jgi:hypothetical protein
MSAIIQEISSIKRKILIPISVYSSVFVMFLIMPLKTT